MSNQLEKFFSSQSTLRVLDKFLRNEYALLAGAGLFLLVQRQGWWEWVEPLLTLVVLPVALATWYEHWRARRRRYSTAEVGQSVIVAVEVNNDTAASITAHFGKPADVFVRAKEEFGGRAFLGPEECTQLAKIVFQRCLPYRNQTIHLVLAGPAGLCFQVGQLLAAHKFDVVPLSWARDHYQAMPRLGTEDIGEVN